MRTQLVITDLTRMSAGAVCIAGYDKNRRCVRPILRPNILEKSLLAEGKPVVFPFAVVELDLLAPRPEPPHTEDFLYDPGCVTYVRAVKDREKVLS